jgi:type II secretory pathway pseudopilin PulG
MMLPSALPARRKCKVNSRRALTFVEVMCAVSILALAAAAMLSATSAVVGAQQRASKRLGAAELANRLMLMYLDNEETMPSEAAPVDYLGDSYRWSKRVVPLELRPAVPPTEVRTGGVGLDRLRAVTITVWFTDEARGQISRVDGTPTFSLTRIVDPIFGPLRNPDTRDRIFSDPVEQRKLIDLITGRGSGSGRTPETPGRAGDRTGGGAGK